MKRLAASTAIALATMCFVVALWKLHYVLVLLLLSIGLAAAARPAADFRDRKDMSPWVVMAGTYGLGLGGLILLLLLASPLLFSEMTRMTDDFTRVYAHFADTWPHGGWLEQNLAPLLPRPDGSGDRLTMEQVSTAVVSALGMAFNLLGLIIDAIIVVVLSIYWNSSRAYAERLWLSLLPLDKRAAARDIWHAIENEVGSYIRSELIQSVFAGIILGLICWAIGFRYPVTLAIMAALGWLVPWVGIVLITATVVVLSTPTFVLDGHTTGLIVGGLTMLVTQGIFLIMEFVVEPRFFNRRRYNSLFTVLTVILLADSFGIFGMLLGPPLAVAVQVLGEQLLQRRATAPSRALPATAADISARMSSVRSTMEESENPPPEVASLVNRLGSLVEETLTAVSSGEDGSRAAGHGEAVSF
jgi:putative permease